MNCKRDNCNGTYEASAKVYFDCELDDDLNLTSLTFSSTNDTYAGHPVALEFELIVTCDECGHEVAYNIPSHGDVEAQMVLHGWTI